MSRNGWLLVAVVVAFLVVGGVSKTGRKALEGVASKVKKALPPAGGPPGSKSEATQAARRAGLLPHVRDALERLQAACRAEGLETYVVSTLRTAEQQAGKVASGVSATQRSWHLCGRAVDLVPVVDGEPDMQGRHVEAFRKMHAIAARIGGWRGIAFQPDGSKNYVKMNGRPVWDAGHLELRDGLTFVAAMERFNSDKGGRIA